RFVGPPASVLAVLGDKGAAKGTAERVNVAVLPGYRGEDQSDEAFIFAARSIGYPVMIKPVAGGGGIGMQTVREEREIRDALAREAGYRNAGTVEFVVDEDGAFYFLEVNARLQVEHPVTEMVFGVDLVEQQLRITQGDALDVHPKSRGRLHAVEARVYAEVPAAGFLPSTGRLVHVSWPEREGVRVDAGYKEGNAVTRHYDPLLAKVIARGDDRRSALGILAKALEETEILGVRTNLAFVRALVQKYEQGTRVDTGLVERILPDLIPESQPAPDGAYAVAAAAVVAGARDPAD